MEFGTYAIVSPFVTAILFGLYLAVFAHCVRWLLFEDEGWGVQKKVNRTLVTTTFLIFFFTTVWFSAVMLEIPWSPIYIHPDSQVPANILVEVILGSNATYWFIPIIIDCVLIHRCWIVFSKNWFIICFPLALWCSCLICTIMSFYCDLAVIVTVITHSPVLGSTSAEFAMCLGPHTSVEALGFYACNIVIGVYTTCALVYQIWHAAKNNSVGTNRLYRICRILTEPGILYTLSSAINLAWWTGLQIVDSRPIPARGNFIRLWDDLHVEIALPVGIFIPGIAFNLITIRVCEQRTLRHDTWMDSSDGSKVPMSSELLNNLGQEEHEKRDEGNAIETCGTENEEFIEVDRTPERQV